MPTRDVVIGDTPLFFSAQGSVVNDSAVKKAKSETKAGAGHLNDAPSGRGRLATREVGRLSFFAPILLVPCYAILAYLRIKNRRANATQTNR